MAREQSFFEQLQKGIGDAITDIREKVVEEPMYGRTLSDRDSEPLWQPSKDQEPAQEKGSLTREIEKAPEREQDRDMDR